MSSLATLDIIAINVAVIRLATPKPYGTTSNHKRNSDTSTSHKAIDMLEMTQRETDAKVKAYNLPVQRIIHPANKLPQETES